MKWSSRENLWASLGVGLFLLLPASVSMVPYPGTVVRGARIARSSAALKDIQLGIKNFQVEYNRYPCPVDQPPNLDFEGEVSGPLLDCLLGKNACGNVRQVVLIEPPIGKDGAGGLIETKDSNQLTDSWGHPFRVTMDTNYDNRIANPDGKNIDTEIQNSHPPAQLPVGAAVFSAGPNGIFFTRDDIVSWRQTPPMPPMPPTLVEMLINLINPIVVMTGCGLLLVPYSIIGLIATRGRKAGETSR